MVHSGSRNLGFKVADYFNKQANKINKKEGFVPAKYNLSPLPIDWDIGKEYYEAMSYCLNFAKANREFLFDAFFAIFCEETAAHRVLKKIDIHHNYAAKENHFGKPVVAHRKGATRANKEELGIIPGSMGDALIYS